MPHPLYSPVRREWLVRCQGPLPSCGLARPARVQRRWALGLPALVLALAAPKPALAAELAPAGGSLGAADRPGSVGAAVPQGQFQTQTPPQPQPQGLVEPQSRSQAQSLASLLTSHDLAQLNGACLQAARADQLFSLQLLRRRLLEVKPAPQPLEVVLANAEALVHCRAPDDALNVLNRYGPAPGRERSQWLLAQWRAADAGLHHRLAAEALLRLAEGRLARLDGLDLTLAVRRDGRPVSRPALDVLADHLVVLGEDQQAAAALLAGRQAGELGAERLRRAAALLVRLPLQQRNQLIETALDQAAAAGAWGLAAELLRDQRALLLAAGANAERPSQRFLRLSRRIDDAYGEWQLGRQASGSQAPGRQDPQAQARQQALEHQLRSPRQSGGHAATLP